MNNMISMIIQRADMTTYNIMQADKRTQGQTSVQDAWPRLLKNILGTAAPLYRKIALAIYEIKNMVWKLDDATPIFKKKLVIMITSLKIILFYITKMQSIQPAAKAELKTLQRLHRRLQRTSNHPQDQTPERKKKRTKAPDAPVIIKMDRRM